MPKKKRTYGPYNGGKAFYNLVGDRKEALGLTFDDLAAVMGTSRKTLSVKMCHRQGNLTILEFTAMCDKLKVNPLDAIATMWGMKR